MVGKCGNTVSLDTFAVGNPVELAYGFLDDTRMMLPELHIECLLGRWLIVYGVILYWCLSNSSFSSYLLFVLEALLEV